MGAISALRTKAGYPTMVQTLDRRENCNNVSSHFGPERFDCLSVSYEEGPMSNQLPAESLRNVAMISSVGVGKTSLAEAILFTTGALPHLGSIAQGTTTSDFEPEELHRRSSVSTSLLRCSWNHTTINLIDPP